MAEEFNSPQGVPISGIIFGGRRKTTIPLVYETKSWDEGVFAASIMGSETTAAAAHQSGVVRRDPMAMLPFCGYNMGDYFKHWLGFGKKVKHLPKVFMVNWFRKGEDGSFLWPGFRENSRILKWMIDRIEGKAGAKDTPIGLMPKDGELDLSGLDIPKASMDKLLEVNKTEWAAEIPDIEKFYSQFGDRVPAELKKQLEELKKKFA